MKTKLIIFMILALLMPIGYAYAWGGNDNSDRISNDQAGVFSPGYLNAAKQQAYSIVNQNNQPKSWWDNLVDKIKNKTSKDVKEDANTKITPEVKKKTSSKTLASPNQASAQITTHDVRIGDGSTRIIDGVTYYFVGFGDQSYATSALQQAINDAANNGGGTIIVKQGEYSGALNMKNGVNIYGGYNDDGIQDVTRTDRGRSSILLGSVNASGVSGEINGFLSSGGMIITGGSITVKNCTFEGYNGIYVDGDYAAVYVSYCKFQEYAGIKACEPWSWYSTSAVPTAYIFASNNTFQGEYYGIESYSSDVIIFSNSNNYLTDYGIVYPYGITNGSSENDYFINTSYEYLVGEVYNTVSNPYVQSYFTENSPLSGIDTPLSISNTNDNINQLALNPMSSDYWRNISNANMYGTYSQSPYETLTKLSNSSLATDIGSGILKELLGNKNMISVNMKSGMEIDRELLVHIVNNLGNQDLTADQRAVEMDIALALANILKNPTDDQKLILDAVESLLADMRNLEEKAGKNPELNKAENDLLQMVATCLLAQGVPDLLKAGDIEGIKGIFKDLGQTKDKIMMDYGQSIKPYYSNIVKELSSNLAMLQLKGILSTKITEEELRNLEPKEIDKILEAIRRSNDKSFEMEYLRQQDNKYRKEYLDPQNKALEEKMKLMLGGFTKKITKALEDTR